MFPRLYNTAADPYVYSQGNGLGFLSRCTECRVTEGRNDNYYLDMTVAKTDRLAGLIATDKIVKALPNFRDPPQLFEISSVKVKKDVLTVRAQHIKNLLYQNCLRSTFTPSDNPSQTVMDGTPQQVVNRYLSYLAITDSRFSFSSDITTQKAFECREHKSKLLGELFGDKKGGLLYEFGGEYHYNNWSIELLQNRGRLTNRRVTFGAELSDYEQTATNDAAYTHVQGWCKVLSNDTLKNDVYISGTPYVAKPNAVFPKMKMVDFTNEIKNEFGSDVTVTRENNIKTRLTQLAQQFYQNKVVYHENAQISIMITYEPDIERLKDIGLCDTLSVRFGGSQLLRTKVTSIVFDSLAEKNIAVGIGDPRTRLSDFIETLRR